MSWRQCCQCPFSNLAIPMTDPGHLLRARCLGSYVRWMMASLHSSLLAQTDCRQMQATCQPCDPRCLLHRKKQMCCAPLFTSTYRFCKMRRPFREAGHGRQGRSQSCVDWSEQRWPEISQCDGPKSRTVAQHALRLSAVTWLTVKGFHIITTCASVSF